MRLHRDGLGIVYAISILAALMTPAAGQENNPRQVVTRFNVAWQKCLDQSFTIQSTHEPDPNLAAEAAFLACQTEESALRAAIAVLVSVGFDNDPAVVAAVRARIAGLRAAHKRRLLRCRAEDWW
jgi:hypothetical protein